MIRLRPLDYFQVAENMYLRNLVGSAYFEVFNLIVPQEGISSFVADAKHLAHLLNGHNIGIIAEHNAICLAACHKVIIDIAGNRFLYNMVRAIVGTLLEIEGHNLPAEHMKQVLDACDRTKAGQTVSPYGLTLIEVTYN